MGQVYYGLSAEGNPLARKETLGMTYEYLTSAIKPKYQLKETMDWVVDRLLIASVVMKDPSVLSGDQESQVNPDVAIDVHRHYSFRTLIFLGRIISFEPRTFRPVSKGIFLSLLPVTCPLEASFGNLFCFSSNNFFKITFPFQ